MRRGLTSENVLMEIFEKLYAFYGPQGWWPGRTRFETIVGAILTQNTAWTNVERAIENLKKRRLLSPISIKDIDKSTLARLIRPAGYYNIKSKRLKNFVDFLFSKYKGSLAKLAHQRIENLRRELLSVNGIGPETCDSIILYALGKPTFVVDAYTKRIFSRHNIFYEKASYDEIRRFFMEGLPKDEGLYNEYHALIVRLGKDLCKKVPNCASCPMESLRDSGFHPVLRHAQHGSGSMNSPSLEPSRALSREKHGERNRTKRSEG